MWKRSECDTYPSLLDTTSSDVVNYVRKNVKTEEREDMDGTKRTVYVYLEQEVLKDDWDTYKQIIANVNDITDTQEAIGEVLEISDTNSSDITDIQEAVSELMEMIMEG